MGFILSKSMDANFKKQQEFMLHNSRLQVSEGAPAHSKTTVFALDAICWMSYIMHVYCGLDFYLVCVLLWKRTSASWINVNIILASWNMYPVQAGLHKGWSKQNSPRPQKSQADCVTSWLVVIMFRNMGIYPSLLKAQQQTTQWDTCFITWFSNTLLKMVLVSKSGFRIQCVYIVLIF